MWYYSYSLDICNQKHKQKQTLEDVEKVESSYMTGQIEN